MDRGATGTDVPDVAMDGFRAQTGFRPSRHGFRFTNSFADEPVVMIRSPLGRWRIGRAGNGLCGGMVFAALDYFDTGRRIPADAEPPAYGTAVFGYLVRRLIAAFNLPVPGVRYLHWMLLADAAVRRRTLRRQWPRIRSAVQAGRPCPLGVVTVRSWHPAAVRHNHVVLAYGFSVQDGIVRLAVYDPNTPAAAADDVHIDLPLDGRPLVHTVDLAGAIRGVFVLRYRRRTPPPLLP